MRYSFTLFERTADGSRVRVQTDSTDQPFDINEGSKLELGSTAKLRVLTTYLEIIAELHDKYAGKPAAELKKVPVAELDRITQWSLEWLMQNPKDQSLDAMLDAALERKYSANTGEAFFTGGGMHVFNNFRKEDNSRNPTLKIALRESINLPFIRLMRDLVRYVTYQQPFNREPLLKDDSDPRRQEYLARFADKEGTNYLMRFWKSTSARPPSSAWTPSSTACASPRSAWPPCTATCSRRPDRKPSTPSSAPIAPTTRRLWPSSPMVVCRRCTRPMGPASTTCPIRATSPKCTRWTCGCWAICSRTPVPRSPRWSTPADSSARRSTAGCSRAAIRAPATAASGPWSRSKPSGYSPTLEARGLSVRSSGAVAGHRHWQFR